MKELFSVPNGNHCVVNQVLYHLGSRGVEFDLLPWLKEHNVPLMAYCPLAQAGDLQKDLLQSSAVKEVARIHGITPMQVLLAFVLYKENVIAIPRSGKAELGGGKGSSDSGGICQIRCCFSGTSGKNIS